MDGKKQAVCVSGNPMTLSDLILRWAPIATPFVAAVAAYFAFRSSSIASKALAANAAADERRLRAYVQIIGVAIEGDFLRINVKNFGATPAFSLVVSGSIRCVAGTHAELEDLDLVNADEEVRDPFTLMGGDDWRGSRIKIVNRSSNDTVFAFVRLSYIDVFNKHRVTHEMFRAFPDQGFATYGKHSEAT